MNCDVAKCDSPATYMTVQLNDGYEEVDFWCAVHGKPMRKRLQGEHKDKEIQLYRIQQCK